MNKKLNICIITEESPSKDYPIYPFIEQLCVSLSNMGIKVSLISPQSITKFIFRRIPLKKTINCSNGFDIYRPLTISFGNIIFLRKFNSFFFSRAFRIAFRNIKNRPDVIYAHFWHNGLLAHRALNKHNLPLFIASGESEIEKIFTPPHNLLIQDFIISVKGVICVSSKNKSESVKLGLSREENCIVLPNGINFNLFYKKDKRKNRDLLGFSHDVFIVAFVGSFEYRKGANRVADAISKLNEASIKSIFIGKPLDGTISYPPNCDGILFKGSLPHNKIADYLNCADVFVLPSLAEGCSNSIIEALGCGLPIISSNLPFNNDILDETNSILIDPNNIGEIASAINELKNNAHRQRLLSKGALKTSQKLSIDARAQSIYHFINEKLSK